MLRSRLNLVESTEELTHGEYGEEGGEISESRDEAVVEEEKIVYPSRPVRRHDIIAGLGLLGKTAEGDGYTYLKVTLNGLKLTDLSLLTSYKHLQYVDVSNNNLESEALQVLADLPFLVLVHADKNVLHSAALKRMKYLQVLIMNHNLITSVNDVYQPELCTLEVGYNKINRVTFTNKMPHIKVLDFRYNFIEDIADFNFSNLDSLYLAGNKITSLQGLERLVNLRILHMRNNPIKSLDGFHECLTKLQYVNLRNCKVLTLRQVKKLKVLKSLETLVMKGCPYMGGAGEENPEVAQEEEDAELRLEILATLPRLKRINKGVVTPEERTEAKDLITQWIEEGEKDDDEIEDEHEEQSIVED
ncbi:unnamed protein product [Chilo suppressalis]|uniref:U2A'/phosphoprotein 32 family A C-terminal domain-containing protein n=1 Tax=Chilo suppressalis TaxID=168631 RepID=A0ABN8BA95_CHISP|nr:unnamed protein product [Chilo suppressalis]